jgi:hypothetical protein
MPQARLPIAAQVLNTRGSQLALQDSDCGAPTHMVRMPAHRGELLPVSSWRCAKNYAPRFLAVGRQAGIIVDEKVSGVSLPKVWPHSDFTVSNGLKYQVVFRACASASSLVPLALVFRLHSTLELCARLLWGDASPRALARASPVSTHALPQLCAPPQAPCSPLLLH